MTAGAERPRVLLLQHAVYPYRRPLFEHLGQALDLTVVFCVAAKSFRRWDTSAMFEDAGFRPVLLPHVRIGPFVFNHDLGAELRRSRYDAIVIGVIDMITLPQVVRLVLAAHRESIPVVVCEEFFPTAWYLRARPLTARIAMWTRRLVYRHCASVVTWNAKARAFVLACGLAEDRVFTGPHAYPAPPVVASQPAWPRRVVTITYFLPRKGIDLLIDAFCGLDVDAELHIGGDGPADAALRSKARGDPRIRFHGYVDGPAKDKLLASAYLFVLPTLWDPWGLVVNEALYRGVPVLVTDASGVSSDVDGAGVVIPAGDVDELRYQLRRLLTEDASREQLAASTADVVARWTVEAQARPFIAAVEAALSRERK